jgi:hypothetical protein
LITEKGDERVKTALKTVLFLLISVMLFAVPMLLTEQVHATEVQPPSLTFFPPGTYVDYSISSSETPPIFTFGEGDSSAVQIISPDQTVELPPLPGIIGLYYTITIIGGSFSQVRICVYYDPSSLPPGANPQNLRLFIGDPVDFNGDGTVNGQDIALMQKAIKSGFNDLRYDINHDGKVDNADLLIVKQFASHGLIVNQGQNGLSQARLSWLDITTHVDTTNDYVCGVSDHLSGIGIHQG